MTPLGSLWCGLPSTGLHQIHSSCLSNHKALVAQHQSHLWISWPFSNFMVNSCLWHWVCRAAGKNITVALPVFAHENQAVLSSSRSYAKRRAWTVCPEESVQQTSEEKTKEGEGRESQRGHWLWRESAPGEAWSAWVPKHIHSPSNSGWQRALTSPNTLRPSPQQENFSWCQFFFFFNFRNSWVAKCWN